MQSLRSPSALVCEGICLLITIVLLFYNVILGHESFSITHIYIVLGLVVALGAGTYMEGFKSSPFLSTAFFVFFVTGTAFCVTMSGSRSAAVYEEQNRLFNEATNQRDTAHTRLNEATQAKTEAKATYDSLDAKASAAETLANNECNTGKGTRCDGKRSSATNERAKADVAFTQLAEATRLHAERQTTYDSMHVPAPSNPELRAAAATWVRVFGGDQSSVFELMQALLPYFLALMAEGATLAFHKKAWGPQQRTAHQTLHVSIGDIAHDLRIEPRAARKALREGNIPKPADGWVWKRGAEADAIKMKIQQAISTTH